LRKYVAAHPGSQSVSFISFAVITTHTISVFPLRFVQPVGRSSYIAQNCSWHYNDSDDYKYDDDDDDDCGYMVVFWL
jgi:hypothetical protein